MAKSKQRRIYFEAAKKWGSKAGIAMGISGFALLFMYLSFLGVWDITGYSGDSICAGTLKDPCLAFINVTMKNDTFLYPIGYDPYGRETPFYTDTELESWKIYRSWGKGWREIDLTKTCTGTWCGAPDNKGVAYSFVLRDKRDYQIKIEAIKKNPSDTIKWGFGPVDPTWFGVSSESNELEYKTDKKKATLKDALNDPLVEIELTSHDDLNIPINVSAGEQSILNITMTNFSGNYEDFLGVPLFLNLETGEFDQLDYYWEKANGTIEVLVPDEKNIVCNEIYSAKNDSTYTQCNSESKGFHLENKTTFERFDGKVEKGEDLFLNLVVDVPRGILYDARPIIFGKEVSEWAAFINPLQSAHGESMSPNDPVTLCRGHTITDTSGMDWVLNNATTFDVDTDPTTLHLKTLAGIYLSNATIDGNLLGTLDYGPLTTGIEYVLCVDSVGSSFKESITGATGFMPFEDTTLTWNRTWVNDAPSGETRFWSFTQITTAEFSVPDDEAPLISNFTIIPTNNSEYFPGSYDFNSSMLSANGSAIFQISGDNFPVQNFTVTNSSLSNYNVTIPGLGKGTYSINWSSHGNGSNANFNYSNQQGYTVVINSSSPTLTFIDGDQANKEVAIGTIVLINSTNNADQGNVTLYVAESQVNSSLNQVIIYHNFSSAGVINVTGIYNETFNYSTTSSNYNVTVLDFTEFPLFSNYTTLTANNSEYAPQNYVFNTSILSGNGSAILQLSGTDFPVKNYSVTNHSLSGYSVSIPGLSKGTYSYNWSTAGNGTETNFNYSTQQGYSIDLNSSYAGNSVAIAPSTSEDFLTETTATGTNVTEQLAFNLFRDNSSVSNPEVITLGVGEYSYIFNNSGNVNYSAKSFGDVLTINQLAGSTFAYINGSRANVVGIQKGTILTLNGTREVGEGNVTLYVSDALVNSSIGDTSILYNFSTVGDLNVTAILNETQNYTFSSETWNISVIDSTEFPNFANETAFTANNSEYSNQDYIFNASILSANGSAIFQISGAGYPVKNFTATNTSAKGYNVTIPGLSTGIYIFNWSANGNSSTNNFNSSNQQSYTIAINSSYLGNSVVITPSTSEEYPVETTATGTNVTEQIAFNLFLDNVSRSNPDVDTLSAGEFSYIFNTSGNINYTTKSFGSVLTIAQNSSLELGITGTSPITFGEITDVSGSGCPDEVTCSIDNPNIVYGAGTHFFNHSTPGNVNYTAASINMSVIVNQNASLVLTYIDGLRANANIQQGTIVFLNATNQTGEGNTTLRVDGVIINSSLGNTIFEYNFSSLGFINVTGIQNETQNFTRSFETFFANITDVTEFPFFANFSSNVTNGSVYSPGQVHGFNSTALSSNGSAIFELGGNNYTTENLTLSPNIQGYFVGVPSLSAGIHLYNWSSFGNSTEKNYNNSGSFSYTIERAASEVNFTVNNNRSNVTIRLGVILDLNGTLITGDAQNISISVNSSDINSSTSPIYNAHNFTVEGTHNVTLTYNQSVNYTTSFESYFVEVDGTNPSLVIVSPPNNSNFASASGIIINYTFSDPNIQNCFWSNNTWQTNHTITCGENISTSIEWDPGVNVVYIGANDTLGHVNNSESITFNVNVLFQNISSTEVELRSQVNISANGTSEICVDIDHPQFGKNVSCGTVNAINFTINWFRETNFNDSNDFFNMSFNGSVGQTNRTFYIASHQYDELVNASINLTGFFSNNTNPLGVKVYVNGTLSNTLGFLTSTNAIINQLNDTNFSKIYNFSLDGEIKVDYLQIPKSAVIVTGTFNMTSPNLDFNHTNYYIDIFADDLNVSVFNINEVNVTVLNATRWRIQSNRSSQSYEIQKATVLETLFYGNNATSSGNWWDLDEVIQAPRVFYVDNISRMVSSDARDFDRRMILLRITSGNIGVGNYMNLTGTFSNPTSNACQFYSNLYGTAGGGETFRSEARFPSSTIVHTVSAGGGEAGSAEIGTDTSGDDSNAPSNFSINLWSEAGGTNGFTYALVLCDSAVDYNLQTTSGSDWNITDFNLNSSVPLFDYDVNPINLRLEVGAVDGIFEFNHTGEFNFTNNQTADFNSSITNFTSTCVADSDGFCNVPFYFISDSGGTLNLSKIFVNYTSDPNPVFLNLQAIENFLGNESNFTNIPIKIESTANGTIQVNDLRYDYAGGNDSINVTIHNPDYTIVNETFVTYWYSRFFKRLPYTWSPDVFFLPRTNNSKNVTPFGQSAIQPIFNLSNFNYGGRNMNLSIRVNETNSCLNLFWNTQNIQNLSQNITSSWTEFITERTYLGNESLWLWADLNQCDQSNLNVLQPLVEIESTCVGCTGNYV